MDNSVYQNPLITRYASKAMSENFSDDKRFKLWRKLWIALAESEMELFTSFVFIISNASERIISSELQST